MKNQIIKAIFALVICLSFSTISHTQKIYFWLDAGVKISSGSGMLYNTNLINDREVNPKFAFLYGIGGKFGFNFGDYHAFTVDGMYNFISQKSEFNNDLIGNVQKRLSFNSVDLYGMYRYNRNLNYVELGVKYSLYQKQFESINGGNTNDVSPFYVDNMLSPVLGFGYYMFNADAFTANLGFRLSYGIDDILSDIGQAENAFTAPLFYDTYKSTNPAFIEVVLELNFGLGQYAKSVCGKRASFMSM